MVHAHVSEYVGHCQGMRDIGVATLAHLAKMAFLRKLVGFFDAPDLFRFQIDGEFVCETLK
jgi:hypothetical protein